MTKAKIGQVWTVDIPPGGTEYTRTVKVTSLTDSYAITENVNTGRKSRIRLAADGSIAGYKLVDESRTPTEASSP